MNICAWCAVPFLNAATYIAYREPSGNRLFSIYERGTAGIERVQRILAGDDPDVEPGGHLEIEGVRVSSWDAVTMIDGSLVCTTHLFDALEQRRYAGRGSRP